MKQWAFTFTLTILAFIRLPSDPFGSVAFMLIALLAKVDEEER